MKIVDQAIHEFKETPTDFEGCLKLIERAGRTCYGSTDNITETSAPPFVEGLIKRGHLSVLRHSNLIRKYRNEKSPYFRVSGEMIGGNFQAWIEWAFGSRMTQVDTLDWIASRQEGVIEAPPELKRYTAYITTSIQNSRQIIRHTTLDPSEKSTRYCDNSNLEIIRPWWWDGPINTRREIFMRAMTDAEFHYRTAIEHGNHTKEDAAMVLPLDTATELWLTGDRDAWLNLKAQWLDGTTGKPSRQMMSLMSQIPWEVIE